MEPMDLDEDNSGPSQQLTLAHFQGQTHASSPAFPYSSPVPHRGSLTLPSFSPAKVLSSSTPQYPATPPYSARPMLRSATFQGSLNISFASPAPVERGLPRGGTLPGGVFGTPRGAPSRASPHSPKQLWQTASDGLSCASMETSDRSDVSEMEVVQNSPSTSPFLDPVRSALSSISLFKNEPDPQQVVPEQNTQGQNEMGETRSKAGGSKSWEPGLSAVQAAVALKHRTLGKKSSPSKLTPESESKRWPQEETVPDKKTVSTDTAPLQQKATANSPSVRKSRVCGCGFCLKLFSLVTIVLAIGFVFLLHEHHHENFDTIDPELLSNEMASNVFGQHVAMKVVPQVFEQYFSVLHAKKERVHENSCFIDPLVLSFHGWTGVGKNFVSDIITGLFSMKKITRFLIPYHFPHPHLDQLYQTQVEQWVLSNVTDYYLNFFLFDEMDKAGPGVIEGIHNAILKLHQNTACRSPVIFLLLSNSFGSDINRVVFQAMMEHHGRESLSLDSFSHVFDNSDIEKDMWYKKLKSQIKVAVPFLPLEKQHIVLCIRRDLVYKKLSTHADLVNRVLQELVFTKLPSGQEFSQTGCKRVSDKVNLVAFE